jgi:hypothetical protein
LLWDVASARTVGALLPQPTPVLDLKSMPTGTRESIRCLHSIDEVLTRIDSMDAHGWAGGSATMAVLSEAQLGFYRVETDA